MANIKKIYSDSNWILIAIFDDGIELRATSDIQDNKTIVVYQSGIKALEYLGKLSKIANGSNQHSISYSNKRISQQSLASYINQVQEHINSHADSAILSITGLLNEMQPLIDDLSRGVIITPGRYF